MSVKAVETMQLSSIDLSQTSTVPREVLTGDCPVLLTGLVNNWPLTQKSLESFDSAIEYLLSMYNGKTTLACKGANKDEGRFFYNESITELNYQTIRMRVDEVLEAIRSGINNPESDNYYIPSNPSENHFPGFMSENAISIPFFASEKDNDKHALANKIVPNLWIGGKTTASCHFDVNKNVACCTTGKRKFTLFPPEQGKNLYPGPFEITPGGPVISMVNFKSPDFEQFPRFKTALKFAQEVTLNPGDAIYIPPLWWHHVEGLDAFNILVNYWWDEAPRFLGSPINALHDAMLSIRDRSDAEKQAYKALFDYYVFSDAETSHMHLPEHAKGILAELDETKARKLRALVISRLNK
uniref:cupin-like domain-containing protein n=1 Tax=Ningiella ruwaisensis TaxID=2364274 RepID=UPI00109FB01D|nr:cupin-like domain-containing protein [Ningiella ruwaisensis]